MENLIVMFGQALQSDIMGQIVEWLLANLSGPSILLLVLVLVMRWLNATIRPRIEKLLDGHIELVAGLNTSQKTNNELIPALTMFVRETHRNLRVQTNTLLIIEDSPMDRYQIETFLTDISHKHGLSLVSVGSLRDAIPLVFQARAIVLDMMLEDSNEPETARLFCRLSPAPVVVFTGYDDLKALSGLNYVSKNSDKPFEKLTEAITKILADD